MNAEELVLELRLLAAMELEAASVILDPARARRRREEARRCLR